MLLRITRPHTDPGVRVYNIGDEIELETRRARIWIQHGIAVAAAQVAPVRETAVDAVAQAAVAAAVMPLPVAERETAVPKPRRREQRRKGTA